MNLPDGAIPEFLLPSREHRSSLVLTILLMHRRNALCWTVIRYSKAPHHAATSWLMICWLTMA